MKILEITRSVLRVLAAIGFIAAGANHFRLPKIYEQIIPPDFPSPRLLVQVSGVCEIIGGVALLVPRLRRSAGCGLIALLIAVFPANIFMATHAAEFASDKLPAWALWWRLPLQGLFIAWVWFVSIAQPKRAE